jgi:hypothetical protein
MGDPQVTKTEALFRSQKRCSEYPVLLVAAVAAMHVYVANQHDHLCVVVIQKKLIGTA